MKVLLLLKDARVDVNLADTIGLSPFVYACYYGYTQIIQLLLSYGRYIDIHKKTTKRWLFRYQIRLNCTRHMAKKANKTDIVQLLQ